MKSSRENARRIAREFLSRGDPKGWFEALYREARGNERAVPWADLTVNPNFLEWAKKNQLRGDGAKALKVGCGLGDDAEELARLGFEVTAFDISTTAIDWCRRRFPTSRVNYCVADLFDAPANWKSAFDFVMESYTLQVLPQELRPEAINTISEFLAPGGTLLVITRGRDEGDEAGKMPWPLTREELRAFTGTSLQEISFEDYRDREVPPVRRFRAEYRR